MDSRAAFKDKADVAILGATSSVDDALKSFEPYELTVDEAVALLGKKKQKTLLESLNLIKT
jgi:hypothetical protein